MTFRVSARAKGGEGEGEGEGRGGDECTQRRRQLRQLLALEDRKLWTASAGGRQRRTSGRRAAGGQPAAYQKTEADTAQGCMIEGEAEHDAIIVPTPHSLHA